MALPEESSTITPSGKGHLRMPRFVVLAHDWPELHYDLLLEAHGVLKAWKLDREPLEFPVKAEPNMAHRLIYLDYEGALSGDRGSVKRWDHGELTWFSEHEFELNGTRLKGRFRILDSVFTVH
jgi:hypothetical protein